MTDWIDPPCVTGCECAPEHHLFCDCETDAAKVCGSCGIVLAKHKEYDADAPGTCGAPKPKE